MKLLVTGGSGFIGSNFILYWLNKYPNDQIVNLDALTYAGNPENLKDIEANSNYQFIHGDITDPEKVAQAIKDADIVVHFAAESHVDRSITGPAIFIKTNIIGTQILLDAAIKNKVKRFHHISTDEVFGQLDFDATEKFTEDTPYAPRSPYAASKAGADYLVKAYFYTYGLPVTITNCSNNFGPFQHPEKLIPLVITNILENKKVPVYGDGKNIRDWLFVTDHCRAIDLVLNRGQIGETYCIGGLTEDVTNLEVIRKILNIMGKDDSCIEFVKDRPGHDKKYAINWTKIRTHLGWQPEADFYTYLKNTVDWYKKNPLWWQNIKKGEYQKYYKNQYQ